MREQKDSPQILYPQRRLDVDCSSRSRRSSLLPRGLHLRQLRVFRGADGLGLRVLLLDLLLLNGLLLGDLWGGSNLGCLAVEDDFGLFEVAACICFLC